MTYDAFLRSKVIVAPESGFDVEPSEVSPALKPHQRDAVCWACKGGRRALFESFGLGKTAQELEWCRLVVKHTGGRALIVLPLGVRQEFTRDAVKLLGMEPPQYVRTMEEAEAAASPILLTNYERVRDGDIDPSAFTACTLDEASVLRSFGSKTSQMFLVKFFKTKYLLVATATPAPNQFKEIVHYSGFLKVASSMQIFNRFFQRNSSKAHEPTLFPHKIEEWWLWVSSWALMLTSPADLGYDATGYDLPPMEIRTHVLPPTAGTALDKDGQCRMEINQAASLKDAAHEKNRSLPARVKKAKEIVDSDPDAHFILWHDLEEERREIERTFPVRYYGHWQEYRDGNPKGMELYERHYSCYHYKDGRERKLFVGPGEKMVLMTEKQDALFVWRKFKDDSGETGINCAVFRNESDILSSELILEAEKIAAGRWPGERLYTYVDREAVQSLNPGYCFQCAGWTRCGTTKSGLIIFEKKASQETLSGTAGLESIYGSMDYDERERRVIDFSEGHSRLFATKKSLSGQGCNFQRHCHRAIFVGIDYEFNDFIQAIHRIYRFLQSEKVIIDIIYTEAEDGIYRALMKKWEQHNTMQQKLREIVQKYGLSERLAAIRMARSIGVDRVEFKGKAWTAVNNDCCEETAQMPDNSVGLIVTSIPFSNQFEYSPSYNDFGHNADTEKFFQQMDFLSPQLLRILKPGRVFACHVKDRTLYGNVTGMGMTTIEPFHALCIQHYMKHGFAYFGMIVVVTDVVRENNQTYRLGWTEQCKDGSKMGVGCPEYILLFRKLPTDRSTAYADDPVVKSKEEYTRAQWQIDAHGFWRSSGDRLISKEELMKADVSKLQSLYRKYSRETVYDYDAHVELAKKLDEDGHLPATFMVVAPGSWTDQVWDDINRMRTLNTTQSQQGRVMHVCPLQLDIVDRLINRYSNEGDLVLDPFGGLGTVALEAIKAKRRGYTIELNNDYFRDAVGYLRDYEDTSCQTMSLFDLAGEGTA